ncbi:hypothetical protein ACOMHN_050555 [Nucella lapillus]
MLTDKEVDEFNTFLRDIARKSPLTRRGDAEGSFSKTCPNLVDTCSRNVFCPFLLSAVMFCLLFPLANFAP